MAAAVLGLGLFSCVCSRQEPQNTEFQDALRLAQGPFAEYSLDKKALEEDLTELTLLPHPLGSPRQGEVIRWMEGRIAAAGAKTFRQPFTVTVPNPALIARPQEPLAQTLTKSGANIYAFDVVTQNAPCVVALATHFDTKKMTDDEDSTPNTTASTGGSSGFNYVGANDSGSSTAALLGQIAYLRRSGTHLGLTCDIIGIFFDGEEAVLPNWHDGITIHPSNSVDHTYGSRFAASMLTSCTWNRRKAWCLPQEVGGKPLLALILMDMIGSPQLTLSRDTNSSLKLWNYVEAGAQALGHTNILATIPQTIEDDHLPFLEAGIPALDIIDFEHRETWHRESDVAANISYENIELASKLALMTAVLAGQKPQVF